MAYILRIWKSYIQNHYTRKEMNNLIRKVSMIALFSGLTWWVVIVLIFKLTEYVNYIVNAQ